MRSHTVVKNISGNCAQEDEHLNLEICGSAPVWATTLSSLFSRRLNDVFLSVVKFARNLIELIIWFRNVKTSGGITFSKCYDLSDQKYKTQIYAVC